ncbi:hypothetical protein ACPOLB_02815 [Rubrivivax sp. RP6-9]|uniref:hypothetical protein n=1 Tax=Rubrivivax sp. RP6-9 TaxID=3415750 RepID=UPI003CC65D2F
MTRPPVFVVPALAALLAGCMGIDVHSVRRADPAAHSPGAAQAVASGRIRHLVDGRPIDYGLLNKPHLSLYHRQSGVLMSSPEVQGDGSYRWTLPAGDYIVAVIFGGFSPTAQPLRLPSGQVIRVNGIVDPGAAFTLPQGAVVDLGTLVVDVESRPSTGLLFGNGPVFGRLRGLRVEPEPGSAAAAPAAWLLAAAPPDRGGRDAAARPDPGIPPAVLAPLLPLLLR